MQKYSPAQDSDCTLNVVEFKDFQHFSEAKMSGLNLKQVDISEQNNKVSLKWY